VKNTQNGMLVQSCVMLIRIWI